MKKILSFILVYCLIVTQAFAQASNPNDQLKIGDKSSASDKGITFDTGDGVSNKKLLIEKISKKLKWNGNSVQLGDGSSSSDKEIIIAGALKSLKYNGTTGDFEFSSDLKLPTKLKTDIIQSINSQVSVKNSLRAEQGIKVGTGNHEIKILNDKLTFSNDGTIYKNFGSGSGSGSGGVNLVKNFSFEDGTGNWTATGLTWVVNSFANGTDDDLKYATITSTTASQTFCSDLVSIPDNFSAGGSWDLSYTASGTKFRTFIKNESAAIIAGPVTLSDVTSWTKLYTQPFAKPNSVQLCLESLAAGTINIDKVYLGSTKNTVSVNLDSTRIGEIIYLPENIAPSGFISAMGSSIGNTAGAYQGAIYFQLYKKLWSIATTTSTDPYYISSAKGSTADADWAANKTITIDESGLFTRAYKSGTSGAVGEKQVDQLQDHEHHSYSSGDGAIALNGIDVKSIVLSSNTNFTGNIHTSVPVTGNHGTETRPTNVAKYAFIRYSTILDSEVAQTPEQASWMIDANIGGGNPNMGVMSVPSYTEITASTLDLVNNTTKGSAQVDIACANGYASSNTGTCPSSNESVGISFVPPYSGLFEVCADFTYYGGSTNENMAAFQLVETPNTSTTILQEGGTRVESGGSVTNTQNLLNPNHVCGTFKFSDTRKKTIRLMYELYGASASVSNLFIDRDSSHGQRDLHFTVRPIGIENVRNILTGDQVVSEGMNKPKIFGVNVSSVCTASPCTTDKKIGNNIVNVTRTETGNYLLNLNSTFNQVVCSGNAVIQSVGIAPVLNRSSCLNCSSVPILIQRHDTGANYDDAFTLLCFGY